MRRTAAWTALTLTLVPALEISAQGKAPPTPAALAGVTERGRALAAYDMAAWHGTDAVMALKPAQGLVTRYIARSTDVGWVVSFGRLNARRDTFFVAYQASPTGEQGPPPHYRATALPTPAPDTEYYLRAARAIETALAEFKGERRPYNVAALPAPAGQWWVYVFPAPTRAGVWPLGGDVRYLVAADGRAVRERRKLHNSIMEHPPADPPDGARLEAGTHAAVLDDIPEDTDVYHVLVRTPRVPQYVVTDAFVYRIDLDGTIHLFGRREDILGR